MDVAGTGFNTTSVVVARVVKKDNNKIDKVQLVNINTIPTSGNFKDDAIFIKKTFYAYGGDLDLVKSKVKIKKNINFMKIIYCFYLFLFVFICFYKYWNHVYKKIENLI